MKVKFCSVSSYFFSFRMFSNKEYLARKTGEDGIGRLSYLQSLVTEFQDTSGETEGEEYKEQILANLANFAYDPINYEHFKKLNIVDLFLDCLDESSSKLIEFAIGGICNCCLDKELKDNIIQNDGVDLVIKCLSCPDENIVMSAVTSLMYLMTPKSQAAICTLPVIECMLRFSKCNNVPLANLATVFLEDYCTSEQVEEAKQVQRSLSEQFSAQQT